MINESKKSQAQLTGSADVRPDPGHLALRSQRSFTDAFSWPPRFFQRHNVAYEWENTPWSRHANLAELDSVNDKISFFLRTDDDSPRHESRVRPVLDICSDARLEDLIDGNTTGPLKKTAWLIDGKFDDENNRWISRPCLGALSAQELTLQLLKKRYAVPAHHGDIIEGPPMVDAERRLIYITDLDTWTSLALITTAPESQARLLGDFMQKHLCGRSSIGVSFHAEGPPMFSLDFHLPFRVWRTTKLLMRDDRTKSSTGEPLRPSRDMTFSMPPVNNTEMGTHGIYSGHVGLALVGYDQWRWTAILATDTWFDLSEDVIGKVERYNWDLDDGIELDPLCCGRDDATKPIWNPRAYFLRVMMTRLEQVVDEWELIRQNLEQGLSNFSRTQKQLFRRMQPFSTGSSDLEQYGKEFEGFEANLWELREALQELTCDLRETLLVGEGFLSTEVNYFINFDGHPGDASECYPYLSEIRRMFNNMAQLDVSFESLKQRCNAMVENCELGRRKYFYQSHDTKSEGFSALQRARDIVQLQVDTARLAEEMREIRTSDLDNNETSRFRPGAMPSRVDLMSLFLRSPVPYFWAITALLTPSSHFIQSMTGQRLLMIAYGLVPLLLVAYSCWLLHASSSSANSEYATTRRSINFLPQHLSRRNGSSGVQQWVFGRLHRMLGGFTVLGRAYQGESQPVDVELAESFPQQSISQPDDVTNVGSLVYTGSLDFVAHIPICLPNDEGCLWKLKQIPRKDCGDDRSFFEALRCMVMQKPLVTWFGFLSHLGLRRPVGLHYVQFSFGDDGQIRILAREKTFPPSSHALVYWPTHIPGSSARPVESKLLLSYYDHPPTCHDGRRDILDQVIHKIDGPFPEGRAGGLGYGLEVEEGPNYHRLAVARLSIVMMSLFFGIAWAWKTGDIQSGFSIAGLLAIVSVIGVATLETTATSRYEIPGIARHSGEMI